MSRPADAAKALERARRVPSSVDVSPEQLVLLAAELAQTLRRRDKAQAALAFIAPWGLGTRRLRLEQLLAAFCCEQLVRVEEIAEQDPALAPLAKGLCALARGERLGNAPRGSTPTVKGLYALGRALHRAATPDADAALRALSSVPRGAPFDLTRLKAGLRLLRGGNRDDLFFCQLDAPEFPRLAGIAYLRSDLRRLREPPPPGLARWDDCLLPALLAKQASRQRSDEARSSLALDCGVDDAAFDATDAVWLHRAFRDLRGERYAQSARGFKQALACGAATGEARRGRWLVPRHRLLLGDEGARRELRRATDDYASWLARDDRRRALQAALWLDTAEGEVGLGGDPARALRALKRARALVEGCWLASDAMLTRLDCAEASLAGVTGNFPRAVVLVERALSRTPTDEALLDAAARLMQMEGGSSIWDPVRARAEAELGARKALTGSSPGALILRLSAALRTPEGEDAAEILRLVDELEGAARLAFDVAALRLASDEQPEWAEAYLAERVDVGPRPDDLKALLMTACAHDLQQQAKRHFAAFCSDPRYQPCLAELVPVARELVGDYFASVLQGKLGAHLDLHATRELKRPSRPMLAGAIYPALLDELDEYLHPEVCIYELDGLSRAQEPEMAQLVVEEFKRQGREMGIPSSALEAFGKQFLDEALSGSGQGLDSALDPERLAERIGALGPQAAARNKRKKQRKQRKRRRR